MRRLQQPNKIAACVGIARRGHRNSSSVETTVNKEGSSSYEDQLKCVAFGVALGFGIVFVAKRFYLTESEEDRERKEPGLAAKRILNGEFEKKAEGFDIRFAQHDAKELADVFRQTTGAAWLVLLGLNGTGKTTTAKKVAEELGQPSMFVELTTFSSSGSLCAVLYDKIFKTGHDRDVSRKEHLAEVAIKRLKKPLTVVLDLSEPASYYEVEHLEKQIKAAAENLGIRFIVVASDGRPWVALDRESRREVRFFRDPSTKMALEYYWQVRNAVKPALPEIYEKMIPDSVLRNIAHDFHGLSKMARAPDGGVSAFKEYDETEARTLNLVHKTCPTEHRNDFRTKLGTGKLNVLDLLYVCDGKFVTLAEKAKLDEVEWFASTYVKSGIASLPDETGRYGPLTGVVKEVLLGENKEFQ